MPTRNALVIDTAFDRAHSSRIECPWSGRCRQCVDRENCPIQLLVEENEILKEEIRVSRESAEITASLVVKQFEETERVLQRFQVANAQRKAVLDSAANMAIIATNPVGTIIVFNRGAENLLGYKASEVIGRQSPLIFHLPQELDEHAQRLQKQIRKPVRGIDLFFHYAKLGLSEQREWTYVHKDGHALPVILSINPLRNPDDALSGFLCIATDITEKKRSEQALKESERNYRVLINTIPNIVFKGYEDGAIDFFDDRIEALTGYPKELFLSRQLKWPDLIVQDEQTSSWEQFIATIRSERQHIREYRIRKKNGDYLWLQASSQVVCKDGGGIEFISGAFLDITEIKSAEAALYDSEEKYRSLFDSGPNPIFVLDPGTLQVLDVNPAAIETYGYSKEELLSRRFTELGEFEIRGESLALEEEDNRSHECYTDQKVRHRKRDGTPFYLRVKACPIKYNERRAIIVAATDITAAIESDAQLFQSSKMKTLGEMSAGIAHELTQPLNAIKIGNDYLKRLIAQGKTISGEELERVATAVTSQVLRASEIINRLREFGRKPDFRKEPVDLNAVILNVMQIVSQQLVLNNIRPVYDLDPDLPPIWGQHNRLEQVVFNLVSNARDAIEQLPFGAQVDVHKISVRTFADDKEVGCAVIDTGVGIRDEEKEKIFEPFFTTKEVGKGMGLGLAITYGIVRDHGGRIDVYSNPGQGTRFELRFPRVS